MGEPPEETCPGTEPGEGDGGVGGAATGQGAQHEFIGAGPGGVGEGVGDALAEDGDAAGGLPGVGPWWLFASLGTSAGAKGTGGGGPMRPTGRY